jgi:hypothetical protein
MKESNRYLADLDWSEPVQRIECVCCCSGDARLLEWVKADRSRKTFELFGHPCIQHPTRQAKGVVDRHLGWVYGVRVFLATINCIMVRDTGHRGGTSREKMIT